MLTSTMASYAGSSISPTDYLGYNTATNSNVSNISSISSNNSNSGEGDDDWGDNPSEGEKLAVSILLVLLSVFGTFGNGLVLYVFTRKSDKVTSTIFILSLAWCDFFTCLIIMPFTVAHVQLTGGLVYDVVCKFYLFLITSNVPLSAFIMVAVAVDRYFSICHPFLHAVTPGRARFSILCLCCLAFTLGIITACMHGVYHTEDIAQCANDSLSHNASQTGSLLDVNPVVDQNGADGTASRGADNMTKFVYDVQVVINQNSFQSAPRQQQQQNATPSPSDAALSPTTTVSCPTKEIVVYNEGGACDLNTIILTFTFFEVYQKVYQSFYIVSLACVFTLYFLIYRSVVKRRAWRRKQKSWTHSPMTAVASPAPNNSARTRLASTGKPNAAEGENMELNPKTAVVDHGANKENGGGSSGGGDAGERLTDNCATDSGISGCKSSDESHPTGTGSSFKAPNKGTDADASKNNCENGTKKLTSSAEKKTNRERRDFNFLANIRTAVMLFVVTIVFIISFLPAWLMAMMFIDYQVFVFYMYFIYNVANPVIYAFMNQSFRKELKRVFQRGTLVFRSV